jgi:hypothetical protein
MKTGASDGSEGFFILTAASPIRVRVPDSPLIRPKVHGLPPELTRGAVALNQSPRVKMWV